MAILEDQRSIDRAEEFRHARKIKSGLPLQLKNSVQLLSKGSMQQKVSEDDIKTLMEMKLAERKFGRFRLTSLGKIVSLV